MRGIAAAACAIAIVLLGGPRATLAALPPNLAPTELEVSPNPPVTGQTATYSVTVVNKGGADATATFHVAFYLDGTLCDTVSVGGGLDAGYETTETTNDPECQPDEEGQHEMEVVVDSGDAIDEGAEGDNTRTAVWTWLPPPMPDLAVGEVDVDPSGDLYIGDPVTIVVTIVNQGDADSKAFYVEYFLDDYSCGEGYVPFAIDPGDKVDLAPLPDECLPLAPGWHEIRVVLDSTETVVESDETNNEENLEWRWYEHEEPDPPSGDEPGATGDESVAPGEVSADIVVLDGAGSESEASDYGPGPAEAVPELAAGEGPDAADAFEPDPGVEASEVQPDGAIRLPEAAAPDAGVVVLPGGTGCAAGNSPAAVDAVLAALATAVTWLRRRRL